jgi:hypothetical protein
MSCLVPMGPRQAAVNINRSLPRTLLIGWVRDKSMSTFATSSMPFKPLAALRSSSVLGRRVLFYSSSSPYKDQYRQSIVSTEDHYWQKIPRWKDIKKEDFLNYKWHVSISFGLGKTYCNILSNETLSITLVNFTTFSNMYYRDSLQQSPAFPVLQK